MEDVFIWVICIVISSTILCLMISIMSFFTLLDQHLVLHTKIGQLEREMRLEIRTAVQSVYIARQQYEMLLNQLLAIKAKLK